MKTLYDQGLGCETPLFLSSKHQQQRVFLNSFMNKHIFHNHACWQSGSVEESPQELGGASL